MRYLLDIGLGRISSLLAAGLAAGSLLLSGAQAAADGTSGRAGAEIAVSVDPRVECISILMRLAGNGEYNQCRVPAYEKAVVDHFGAFGEHPAVKLARQLRTEHGISFDAPMSLAVQLEEGFGLEPRKRFEDWPWGIDSRWTKETVKAFLEQLRSFSKDADFPGFFRENRPLYDSLVASTEQGIGDIGLREWFASFFGARDAHRFRIVMAPTNGPSNYGVKFEPSGGAGTKEVFAIIGVWATGLDGSAGFGADQISTVVHEFCHSYVNPVVEAHRKELEPAGTRIFPKVAAKMRQSAYGNWETMMKESGVRACEIHFVGVKLGEEQKRIHISANENRGFLWIGKLAALLDDYDRDREKYPTFDSFFPRFVDFFDHYELSDEEAASRRISNINSVYEDRSSIVFVVPTGEEDKEAQAKIVEYVTRIRDRLLPDARILTDQEALEEDLSKNGLALYGTLKGNLWLAKHVANHPVRIEADRIVAGEAFSGANLRFISCWPHPENPERGIVIYTAQCAADVVGINDLFHGPTAYVVADGATILKAGDYRKTGTQWSF